MNLPVEVRLIGLVLFNAVIFYIGKMIEKKGGSSMLDMFNAMTGQSGEPKSPPKEDKSNELPTEPPKKMRGPSIKAADVAKMARETSRDDIEESPKTSTIHKRKVKTELHFEDDD
jgi:hypothetical protein